MKILFLAKFYQPFDRGGSEWSTRDLAYLLTKDGHSVTIVTPNYGAKSEETINKIKIIRIPFPIKLLDSKSAIAPFWTNNLIWFIYSGLFCIYISLKNKYKIIHIQNNEFIPAGVITAKILGKKAIVTFRDYQIICNLGFCLWKSSKSCSWRKYMNNDFLFFYKNYVNNKNVFKKYLLLIAVLRARLVQNIVFEFAKQINFKIAVSKKVKNIFEVNGIHNLKVINNAVIINNKLSKTYSNKIVFVGKLSKGKGVDIFIQTLPSLLSRINQTSIEIIGSGYLKESLKSFSKSKNIQSKVKFVGQVDHNEVLSKISNAALVVVPSVWPEPLPRSVIETILSGTPVVATNVGGIEEVLKDNVYGLLAKPNIPSLLNSIEKAYYNKEKFRANIKKDIKKLRNHFTQNTLKLYEQIYFEALK